MAAASGDYWQEDLAVGFFGWAENDLLPKAYVQGYELPLNEDDPAYPKGTQGRGGAVINRAHLYSVSLTMCTHIRACF